MDDEFKQFMWEFQGQLESLNAKLYRLESKGALIKKDSSKFMSSKKHTFKDLYFDFYNITLRKVEKPLKSKPSSRG